MRPPLLIMPRWPADLTVEHWRLSARQVVSKDRLLEDTCFRCDCGMPDRPVLIPTLSDRTLPPARRRRQPSASGFDKYSRDLPSCYFHSELFESLFAPKRRRKKDNSVSCYFFDHRL